MAITRGKISDLMDELTTLQEKVQDLFDEKYEQYENEADKEYPNAGRLEKLEEQHECLFSVKEAIQEAIDELEGYEF